MSALQPVALYGLEVPAGDFLIPVSQYFPAKIRITMAALDPSEEVEDTDQTRRPRSTLKLVKQSIADLADDSDDEKVALRSLLMGEDEADSDDDDDDDEANGGPSDPAKSKKALQAAALNELLDATKDEDDSDDETVNGANGKKAKKAKNGKESTLEQTPNGKGKGKAKADKSEADQSEDEESGSDDDEMDGLDLEQFVVCTLDTETHCQQTLELTIGETEKAFFVNSGTHTIYVTGNYVHNPDEASDSDDSDDDDEYDLPPEFDEIVAIESEDELDDIDGADRIEDLDTDEEVPKLIESKKGKNKRAAEDAANSLDELITKDGKQGTKLSKKQAKKLKNNEGKAVAVENHTPKSEKKVQFAENLEQGPTGSPSPADTSKKSPAASSAIKAVQGPTGSPLPADKGKKGSAAAAAAAAAAAPGIKVVQGVKIDDRKIGKGRAAKSGDKVSMRYIGKLDSGKVFDSNKKGTPFSFKLGKGEVIKGWDIGVTGMAVGGERRLIIPAHLGYGGKSVPGIPANSTLTFDIKLLEIK